MPADRSRSAWIRAQIQLTLGEAQQRRATFLRLIFTQATNAQIRAWSMRPERLPIKLDHYPVATLCTFKYTSSPLVD